MDRGARQRELIPLIKRINAIIRLRTGAKLAMDIAKELSSIMRTLKESDGKSNEQIAELLGTDLDSFDFFELIGIKEFERAKVAYPLEYSRWKSGFTGKFKPGQIYKLSPTWAKFFSRNMSTKYEFCRSSDWDTGEMGDCLILDNQLERHPNFPDSVPMHIISLTIA